MTTLILYCIISYLFAFGTLMAPDGSNWYNFVFAPIFMPIQIGRALAILLIDSQK